MLKIHKKFLLKAHQIAKKNFGNTFPNPSVGCVIVKNNKIISTGVTAKTGRPHAEEIALTNAGKKSLGSTMYVTLEPCNHQSYKGSCTNQIIRSGIKKIYIAKTDPDPRTNKKSIKRLKQNGLYVNVNLTNKNTYELNKFFFESLKNKRPYTKVKMAISEDEKIAWYNYKSKWISNAKSRNFAHVLRNKSQAIVTTSKTIIKDNPRFNIRKNNKVTKYLPLIIIDNSLNTPIQSKIINSLTKRRIIIFTSQRGKKSQYLKKIGCEIIFVKKNHKLQLDLKDVFKKLYAIGIRDVLVESGGIFLTNLLKQKLVDELHIFKAPIKIGHSGIPLLIGKSMRDLKLKKINQKKFGSDKYLNYLIKS